MSNTLSIRPSTVFSYTSDFWILISSRGMIEALSLFLTYDSITVRWQQRRISPLRIGRRSSPERNDAIAYEMIESIVNQHWLDLTWSEAPFYPFPGCFPFKQRTKREYVSNSLIGLTKSFHPCKSTCSGIHPASALDIVKTDYWRYWERYNHTVDRYSNFWCRIWDKYKEVWSSR